MSAYFVAQIEIHDPEQYEAYLAGFDPVFARFEGEVVAVDDHAQELEGRWAGGRTVLIRFPDEEALLAWYRSDEYQELAQVRRRASHANIALVHGRS